MSAAVVRALCCDCGNLRTVKATHKHRGYVADAGRDPRGWRMLGLLKCTACRKVTRHALLRDDRPECRDVVEREERRTTIESEPRWRITAVQRSAEAVRAGRHPGSRRVLTAIDSHGNAIASAFQFPDRWHIDLENYGIRLAGMNPLSANLLRGFCVTSEDEAHDWLHLFAALTMATLRAPQ
ncbi:hypothetical protein M4D79_14105 [Mycolicibacterium novocastrense]|nr:hypothetical protein M4D79_14105 [Mycolicibacterium novocastrense]